MLFSCFCPIFWVNYFDAFYSRVIASIIRSFLQLNRDVFEEQQIVFKARCNALRDPNLTLKLYYCGGKGGTLHRILKEGFQAKDMVPGDYGTGLYFTQNPVRAMQYSEVS